VGKRTLFKPFSIRDLYDVIEERYLKNISMNKKNFIIIIAIIALAAASRLMKHPPNFTPISAIALFGGWYFTKKYFLLIPLAAMFISDIFIGFYDWRLTAIVYLGVTLTFFAGWLLKKNPNWRRMVAGSLIGSITFFVITNFAVWAMYPYYPHTWAGLANCFSMGLPFFKNSLAGDLLYGGVLFGAYEFARYFVLQKQVKEIGV